MRGFDRPLIRQPRRHDQALAALFHADAPNDVAPTGFNETPIPSGLAVSPLAPPPFV